MKLEKLIKDCDKRRKDSIEWMYKQNNGVVLIDDDFSFFAPDAAEELEALQSLYDEYEKKFKKIPYIAMFTIEKQKEILSESIEENRIIDEINLLPG